MATCDCCGCVLIDGDTSLVFGDGSSDDPFTLEMVDPTFWETRPAVRRQRSTNQTITTATLTAVNFTTASAGSFDRGPFFSGANPTRFTFPLAGVYIFGSTVSFADNAIGTRYHEIRLNGTTNLESDESNSDAGATHKVTLSTTYHFLTTDYVELMVRQESGGNLDIVNAGLYSPVFWAVYIGRFV